MPALLSLNFMPTIEIVCLEQKEPLDFPNISFAVEAENEVISHRGLFYEEFKKLDGCIYHLGSPDVRRRINGAFYAAELLDWKVEALEGGRLKFSPQFIGDIQQMFNTLLEASPQHRLIFSSDYQFGPEQTRRYQRPLRLETFWRKHDAGKLWLNARYFLCS